MIFNVGIKYVPTYYKNIDGSSDGFVFIFCVINC